MAPKVKVTIYISNCNIDNVIAACKKCDVSARLSSFTGDSAKLYVKGKTGIWKIAPKFKVIVSTRSYNQDQRVAVDFEVKHSLTFFIMISISVLLFLYIAWRSFGSDTSPIFFAVPFLIALLAGAEDSWQQDRCLKKLEQTIKELDLDAAQDANAELVPGFDFSGDPSKPIEEPQIRERRPKE